MKKKNINFDFKNSYVIFSNLISQIHNHIAKMCFWLLTSQFFFYSEIENFLRKNILLMMVRKS